MTAMSRKDLLMKLALQPTINPGTCQEKNKIRRNPSEDVKKLVFQNFGPKGWAANLHPNRTYTHTNTDTLLNTPILDSSSAYMKSECPSLTEKMVVTSEFRSDSTASSKWPCLRLGSDLQSLLPSPTTLLRANRCSRGPSLMHRFDAACQ